MNNKLFLDTSYILKNKTGIGTYTLNLINLLKTQDYDIKYLDLKLNLPHRYIWQTLWLNTLIYFKTWLERPKYFISPSFVMPYFTHKNINYFPVIYDLSFLRKDEMTKYHRFIFNLSTKIAVKKATTIIVDSQAVKDELVEKMGANKDKIKVVYTTVADYFKHFNDNENIINKYNLQKNKYIISVATLNKRKNIPELIKAFEKISDKYPDIKLVLVGGMGNEQREKLTKHPNIIFTGYIQDEDLPTLYKNALLYMYPSLYEGFGIPLIEAQYCGCPVLCSDISVFKETAQNSARFCEPVANNIAENIEYLINNPQEREKLTKLGYENIKRFSDEEIKKQIDEVMNFEKN